MMKLGLQVGLGHIVLDGNPAPLTERGTAAPTFKIYGRRHCLHPHNPWSMSIVAKWLDGPDEIWHGGRPLNGNPTPFPKGAQPPPQIFGHVCCGQTAGWVKMQLVWR